MVSSKEQMEQVYHILKERQAQDIRIIDISQVSTLADYMIIASGSNTPHIEALTDYVQQTMHKAGCECRSLEGARSARWVLLDYGDIIVNIFSKEDRMWYDLERIWRDGEFITVED